jgi:arylsulfatase A-like enzyme
MDIAPTLLDLAGIPRPAGYDGKSLMPMLVGGSAAKAAARAAWRTRTVISFAGGGSTVIKFTAHT